MGLRLFFSAGREYAEQRPVLSCFSDVAELPALCRKLIVFTLGIRTDVTTS